MAKKRNQEQKTYNNILINSMKASMQMDYQQSIMGRGCFLGRNASKNPFKSPKSGIQRFESRCQQRNFVALTPSLCWIQNQQSDNPSNLQADLKTWGSRNLNTGSTARLP